MSASRGVSASVGWVSAWGVSAPGGVVSQHALRQTPPCEQNDKQVQKYYLGHNFVAAGNKSHWHKIKVEVAKMFQTEKNTLRKILHNIGKTTCGRTNPPPPPKKSPGNFEDVVDFPSSPNNGTYLVFFLTSTISERVADEDLGSDKTPCDKNKKGLFLHLFL